MTAVAGESPGRSPSSAPVGWGEELGLEVRRRVNLEGGFANSPDRKSFIFLHKSVCDFLGVHPAKCSGRSLVGCWPRGPLPRPRPRGPAHRVGAVRLRPPRWGRRRPRAWLSIGKLVFPFSFRWKLQ